MRSKNKHNRNKQQINEERLHLSMRRAERQDIDELGCNVSLMLLVFVEVARSLLTKTRLLGACLGVPVLSVESRLIRLKG